VASIAQSNWTASKPAPVTASRPAVWPAVLLLYAILLPLEAVIVIDQFRLYAYRIVLFVLFPWLVGQLAQGRVRIGPADFGMAAVAVWMTVAITVRYGPADGFERGGVQGFDLFTAYMVGRCCLRSPAAFRRFLVLSLPGLLITGGVLAFESLSGRLIERPFFAALFGRPVEEAGGIMLDRRLGLTRAYGPFPHPILGGLQMLSFLPLFVMSLKRPVQRNAGIVGSLFGLFALSSAAFISFALNIALLAFDWIQKRVRELTWTLGLGVLLAGCAVIHFVSQNGIFVVIIRYLLIDPATGAYRLLIWRELADDVANNPWFGIGFEPWTRPSWMASSSIDAHWLLAAVRFGLPVAIVLGIVTFGSILGVARAAGRSRNTDDRDLLVGLAMTLSTLSLMMFTVTLWSNSYAWFVLLLGGAVGLRRSAFQTAPR
jgi:hypothetical protein